MLRASAIVEKAGVPTTSLICDGFIGQARAVAGGFGIPNLPVARILGHVDSQSAAELADNLLSVTLEQVIGHLTRAPDAHTTDPACAITAARPIDRRRVLFPDMFEPVTSRNRPGPSRAASLGRRTLSGSNG